VRAGKVTFEHLVSRLVNQFDDIRVPTATNFYFDWTRTRCRADEKEDDNEGNESHIAVLTSARQILQDRHVRLPSIAPKPLANTGLQAGACCQTECRKRFKPL
jgi:hypothetical protein